MSTMVPTGMDLILQYGFVALGLIASLALFLILKGEMQKNARRHRRQLEEITARIAAQAAEASHTAQAVPEPVVILQPSVRSGFNLSRRVQAMRLLRRGENLTHVAAALGVPQKEVELLVRIQQMSAQACRAHASRVRANLATASGAVEMPNAGQAL